MYCVKNDNIERIVDTKEKCDEYISRGFVLLQDKQPQNDEEINLSKMTVDELIVYAAEHGIDIGNAASQRGILKKIKGAGGEDDGAERKDETPTGDNDQ